MLRRWNIAVGNTCFRYRNALFPAVFALVVPLLRPCLIGHSTLDRLLVGTGVGVALVGELVRLVTIGFEYIERGGKEGKVYASRLVQGGVYGLTRNPMYVGNALIATGMTMVAGAPWIYLAVLPFFLFVYQAIIAAEEAYLRGRFGEAYDRYCARVPRLLPAFRNASNAFAGMRYNWKSAARQELSTIAGLGVGLTLLPIWRMYWLEGWDAAKTAAPSAFARLLVVMALYGFLIALKRNRRLFY